MIRLLMSRRLGLGGVGVSVSQGTMLAASSKPSCGRCLGSSAVARAMAESMARHASVRWRSSGISACASKSERRRESRMASMFFCY